MTTTTNVTQVKVNLMTQQMYDTATKNVNEFYVITDNDYVETSDGVLTIQPISTVTYASDQTVTLTDDVVLYKITPSGNINSMTFSASGTGASASAAYTFELLLDMSSSVYTVTWPSSVYWMNDEAPDLSEVGRYFFAFRTLDGGNTWLGNMQGRW